MLHTEGNSTRPLKNDACRGISINAFDDIDRVLWEAEGVHDAVQFGVINGVKSVSEIYVGNVDIAVGCLCIFEKMYQTLQVAGGVMFSTEPFLGRTEDAMVFRKLRDDGANKTGPKLIESVVRADWAFIGQDRGVVLFMEKSGMRDFPGVRCGASDPHEDKEVPYGGLEGGRYDAKKFVGDAVWAWFFWLDNLCRTR